MITCKKHKKYKACREPKSNCEVCWVIWTNKRIDELVKRVSVAEDSTRSAHADVSTALYVANLRR